MPPRRRYLSGYKLVKTAGNKYKCPICTNYFNSHTEVVYHIKEIHQTTLLGAIYQQDSEQAGHLLFKKDSHKEESCKELDRLINELTRAKEKYLPLIEHGYPVKYVFTQSRQSILQLKEKFKTFTQRQLSLTQTILYKRVSAEKEKVATTIKNLCEKIANLKNELIKKNKQIALLTEKHKKLLDTHESLLKNHTTLKNDYDVLLENNSDYYVERCHLLEQENCVLVNQIKLFEETEELRKEIGILFEEIKKLKKRNDSLSCMIDSIWNCFSNKILLVVYTNVDYSQIYDLNPLLELNIGTSRESGYGEEKTF
ncbi:44026_t:CDS:2 [Gigaspora margarita]|uniref:44026_t:CDS:1 n=1 Tax=Gigaspora margarita TaxID=4874 RepID=A0ABN7W318_GIGMA|nr:44026_t:CDS:2 [Gigaspora margarita]